MIGLMVAVRMVMKIPAFAPMAGLPQNRHVPATPKWYI